MEDLYKILGVGEEVSKSQLKQAFQKLALLYHPDKNTDKDNVEELANKFVKVNKAWNILGNEQLRKEYDSKWKQRLLAQDWPIQDEVHIEEFDEDEDQECFWWDCRCSGKYILQLVEVQIQVDFVLCDTCSLCIRVKYDE